MIKPGTQCWLRDKPPCYLINPNFNGRVVEVIGLSFVGMYTIEAPWLHEEFPWAIKFLCCEHCLVPFSDPDPSKVDVDKELEIMEQKYKEMEEKIKKTLKELEKI